MWENVEECVKIRRNVVECGMMLRRVPQPLRLLPRDSTLSVCLLHALLGDHGGGGGEQQRPGGHGHQALLVIKMIQTRQSKECGFCTYLLDNSFDQSKWSEWSGWSVLLGYLGNPSKTT